jgi:hypothetical protein
MSLPETRQNKDFISYNVGTGRSEGNDAGAILLARSQRLHAKMASDSLYVRATLTISRTELP